MSSDPTYHPNLVQGSDEWLAQRCGKMTASEMHLLLTPTLKVANNEKTRAHLYELLAQRITQHVEPRYVSDDMLRGQDDELEARRLYSEQHGEVTECGFVTAQIGNAVVGYSPDGLVGDRGLLECKSRRQKFQIETFIRWHSDQVIPSDYMLQIQTGLLVTGRDWLDLVSYSGGLPMCVMRVLPNEKIHAAIREAVEEHEAELQRLQLVYTEATRGLKPTKRRVVQEMFV